MDTLGWPDAAKLAKHTAALLQRSNDSDQDVRKAAVDFPVKIHAAELTKRAAARLDASTPHVRFIAEDCRTCQACIHMIDHFTRPTVNKAGLKRALKARSPPSPACHQTTVVHANSGQFPQIS